MFDVEPELVVHIALGLAYVRDALQRDSTRTVAARFVPVVLDIGATLGMTSQQAGEELGFFMAMAMHSQPLPLRPRFRLVGRPGRPSRAVT